MCVSAAHLLWRVPWVLLYTDLADDLGARGVGVPYVHMQLGDYALLNCAGLFSRPQVRDMGNAPMVQPILKRMSCCF